MEGHTELISLINGITHGLHSLTGTISKLTSAVSQKSVVEIGINILLHFIGTKSMIRLLHKLPNFDTGGTFNRSFDVTNANVYLNLTCL